MDWWIWVLIAIYEIGALIAWKKYWTELDKIDRDNPYMVFVMFVAGQIVSILVLVLILGFILTVMYGLLVIAGGFLAYYLGALPGMYWLRKRIRVESKDEFLDEMDKKWWQGMVISQLENLFPTPSR